MGELCQEPQLGTASLRLIQPEQLRDRTLESRHRHYARQAVGEVHAHGRRELTLPVVTR